MCVCVCVCVCVCACVVCMQLKWLEGVIDVLCLVPSPNIWVEVRMEIGMGYVARMVRSCTHSCVLQCTQCEVCLLSCLLVMGST